MFQAIIARLKEPSTWAALGTLTLALAPHASADHVQSVVNTAPVVMAILGALLPEGSSVPQPPVVAGQ
jgi:hypothetical protein